MEFNDYETMRRPLSRGNLPGYSLVTLTTRAKGIENAERMTIYLYHKGDLDVERAKRAAGVLCLQCTPGAGIFHDYDSELTQQTKDGIASKEKESSDRMLKLEALAAQAEAEGKRMLLHYDDGPTFTPDQAREYWKDGRFVWGSGWSLVDADK